MSVLENRVLRVTNYEDSQSFNLTTVCQFKSVAFQVHSLKVPHLQTQNWYDTLYFLPFCKFLWRHQSNTAIRGIWKISTKRLKLVIENTSMFLKTRLFAGSMRMLYTVSGGMPILNCELTWQRVPFGTVTCRQYPMATIQHKKDKKTTQQQAITPIFQLKFSYTFQKYLDTRKKHMIHTLASL